MTAAAAVADTANGTGGTIENNRAVHCTLSQPVREEEKEYVYREREREKG